MPLPVKSLPVLQNWDCHGCGDCCKTYHVRVSEAEKAKIEAQDWSADPELKGLAPIVWDRKDRAYRLNHTADGSCVFLMADNRCRIHAKLGPEAKPVACRIYPFALVPAGDHWRVGIRFACPSAAANRGKPVADKADELRDYAALFEADVGTPPKDPPPLQPGQSVSWPDLLRFVRALLDEIDDTSTAIDHRLRKIVALSALCKKSSFEKVSGARLGEFLDVVAGAVADDVPLYPKDVPEPGWVGRTIFRQVVAVYTRKDNGPNAGIARTSRLTRIKAAWRFALGVGPIPRLHGLMPDTTFEAAEEPAGPLSANSDALLTRYYHIKIESLQFCGPNNFHRPFWVGLDSLLLTFPAILWLARVLTVEGVRTRDEAVELAVRIVDDSFGFNKLLGSGRQAWATQALADRGELDRLIAWYAR
jgi:lysine-N-methylase